MATVIDGMMYGLGTSDMKAGCAAPVYAVAGLAHISNRLSGKLLVALTDDEEGGGADGACYLVKERALRADVAMIAEPAGMSEPWEVLPLVSRGLCCLTVRVQGTQLHSSISRTRE